MGLPQPSAVILGNTRSPESTTPLRPRLVLQGWKEIARELDRGIRTVQRWELKLKLPIHRLGRASCCPVFAFQDELQRWLREKASEQDSVHSDASYSRYSRGNGSPARGPLSPPALKEKFSDQKTSRARTPEIIKSLNAFFSLNEAVRKHSYCDHCNSPAQFLIGQFWLYGTDKTWQVSVPFCPQCDPDVRALMPPSTKHIT